MCVCVCVCKRERERRGLYSIINGAMSRTDIVAVKTFHTLVVVSIKEACD